MSEEQKHKLSKILYYSDIHPADTEFINNIIYDLQKENKQLKDKIEKLKDYGEKVGERRNQLYERIDKATEYLKKREEDNMCCSVCSVMSDKLLAILGDKE